MRALKITVAYDGTRFAGWQIQPRARTVQQELQAAWQQITGEASTLIASGRTDAGVHALGQVCSLVTESRLSAGELRRALQANTPEDISVLKVDPAPPGFHAIRDARQKQYRYQIQTGAATHLFMRHYAWHVYDSLDVGAMRGAADTLRGEHDFASFQASGADRVSTIRRVTQLEVQAMSSDGYPMLAIVISANGFLYNMVRNIVGTMVEVGRGRRGVEWVREVLAAKDRRVAGPTAPARGLCLMRVDYDDGPGHS